jgi:sugar O-acyltransferase (sialic acid O-acetyltransferase NeuD family)
MKVLIIGSGGHARVVADILLAMKGVEPLGFASRNATVGSIGPLGLPILGDDSAVGEIKHDGVIVAIGKNRIRKQVFDRLEAAGETLVSAVHPTAILSPDVVMGKGCVVCAGAIVNTGSTVGDNVILNTGCTVDHDCSIGQHVHIAPGVNLAGDVVLGDGAFLGIGSSFVPRVRVGDWATLGAGAVVINDIAADCVAVGVPAKVMSK